MWCEYEVLPKTVEERVQVVESQPRISLQDATERIKRTFAIDDDGDDEVATHMIKVKLIDPVGLGRYVSSYRIASHHLASHRISFHFSSSHLITTPKPNQTNPNHCLCSCSMCVQNSNPRPVSHVRSRSVF